MIVIFYLDLINLWNTCLPLTLDGRMKYQTCLLTFTVHPITQDGRPNKDYKTVVGDRKNEVTLSCYRIGIQPNAVLSFFFLPILSFVLLMLPLTGPR